MKLFLFIEFFVLSIFSIPLYAQTADTSGFVTDTLIVQTDSLPAQVPADSGAVSTDSIPGLPLRTYGNKLVNSQGVPVSAAVQLRQPNDNDLVFYLVAAMVLLLGFLKFFYSRYFNTLFRVFFNSSLRQSQLTDQLLMAKLPSLLFNLFFLISGGIYLYLLLLHFDLIREENKWVLAFSFIILLGLVYFLKFCILKFTGWITGLVAATNTYIFITFLINKILGIFLVPFVVVLAFSDPAIVNIAVLISVLSIAVFLLLRFFRSFGLLQNQLKISRFHFFLYVIGIELMPLLLIYKGLMVYLGKNL